MEPETQNVDKTNEGSAGPIIGTIIILVVIILGGLYFWSQRDNTDSATENRVESIETQGDSDDVSSIEADLEATNVNDLGSELDESTL